MIKRFPFFSSFVRFLLLAPLYCQRVDNVYRGRYTGDGKFSDGYEIVIPRKVSSNGEFVSHRIPHHFGHSSLGDRKKRNIGSEDTVHYRLQIDGEEHHLELRPNGRLLGAGAVVEEHREHWSPGTFNDVDFLKNVKLRRARDTGCHCQGRVRNGTESSALSTCHGLAGYIRTGRSWYTIEPVAGHDSTKEAGHPHIVYKRRPTDGFGGEFLCNVTGNMAKTIAKRALNPRKSQPPKKRANSNPIRTLELLLVLDKSLLDYHGDFDVENYVLTLLNMAAGLFHDVSLGITVELTCVRIIRLEVEDKEMNLSLNKDVRGTLERFQEWQRTMNPGDDSHPNHHDCAVLIGKTDVCVSPSLCGFIGASTIAATCDPLKGAAIVQDLGLQTGYHIAHHLGHTLGMSHDVEEDNGCPGVVYHGNGYAETTVMHPGSLDSVKRWSECSRKYLRSFIESGMGFCLEDTPQDRHYPSMELLPGVMYNGDDQCRLRYRLDARQCDLGITCEALRCAIPGRGCVSTRKPPAEGTPCGEKRWCYETKCLMVGKRPGATDGGWGTWSSWSPCSRTCGSGVAFSMRRCNSPSPSKGGLYCRGDRRRHKICATEPCDVDAPSFRDVQCSEFNDWVFPEDGRVHRWTAYALSENLRASENPCALYCLSETNLVASLRPKVVDGTTCYRGIRDICVDGVCREIPCDLKMESNAVEDVCGVCKGDSTSCRLKEGTKTFEVGERSRKMMDVPAGSRNIRVEETKPSKSRIMVRTKRSKNVLIDGNRLGMFDVPGSKAWLGTIRPSQEALDIPGPVLEDLVILVLPKENVTLKYSLGLKEKSPRKPVFSWDFVDWGKCSANCGPGEQISKPRCVEKLGGLVDDTFCENIAKPDARVRPCNQAPCLPRWTIGDWQGCTPCVPGCERRRAVKCVRPVGRAEQDVDVIADSYCQSPKPRELESCGARRRRADVLTRRETGKNHDYVAGQPIGPPSFLAERSRDNRESPEDRYHPAAHGTSSNDRSSSHRVARPRDTEIEPVDFTVGSEHEGGFDEAGGDPMRLDGTIDETLENESDVDEVEFDVGKRSDEEKLGVEEIRRGETVIDKQDVKNLTLTILLERDERNNAVNFPRDFVPQPPENVTEFTLVGMDAIRYVQRIQEEARTSTRSSFSRKDR